MINFTSSKIYVPQIETKEKRTLKPIQITGNKTQALVYTSLPLDYKTLDQLKILCSHPSFENSPIRVMPDVHPSANTLVGFSAPVNREKVIPGIIGGDIGCGMLCVQFDTHGKEIDYKKLDEIVKTYTQSKRTKTPKSLKQLPNGFNTDLKNLCKDLKDVSADEQASNLGTLGGGNHFIEIDKDKNGKHYLIIHTGSRGFGKEVANHHGNIAKKQNRYNIKELSYLSGDEAKKYMEDIKVAQKYAQISRRIIADEILFRMGWDEKMSFESVHNYISDDGIMRKGAISAKEGEHILIPLNMRDGVILAKGKGNPEWNKTAPHGAGRIMSRGEASKNIPYETFVDAMKGIYTTSVSTKTLDEAPQAYKPSGIIIDNIKDTAQIEDVIKPKYNYKESSK